MKFNFNCFAVLLLILLSISCSRKVEEPGFLIRGEFTDAPDKGFVYIQSQNFIDSTRLDEGRFTFRGKVEEPTRTAIFVKNDSRQKLFFWLENSAFVFKGEMGNLSGSRITGGQNQEESNLLEDLKKPIRRSMDSIAKVLKNESMSDSARASTLAFYHNLLKKEDKIEQKFVRQFPNSWEAISVLNQNKINWSAKQIRGLFSNFSTELQSSNYGKSVHGFINQPQIGDKYVDFEQRNTDGQFVVFSDHLESYTLIEFWASWCLPCRKSNPKLVKLYNKYSHRGFTVVGVSIDENEEKWLEAIKQDGLPWVNLTDFKGDQNQAYIAYGIDAIPDNILLDDKGIIVGKYLTTEDLEERLEEIFK